MKIEINGQQFNLSDTSKTFLDKYLERMKHFIQKNNIEIEVYDDIEERIAEKFMEYLTTSEKKKISDKEVIDIVNEIGEPNEILEELIENDFETPKANKTKLNFKEHFSSDNTKLTRNSEDGMLFGVCYGIGERYSVDPLWIRLGFVFGTFLWGMTIILYIVLIFLLPDEAKLKKKVSGMIEEAEEVTENVVIDIKNTTDKIDIDTFKSHAIGKKVKNNKMIKIKEEKIKNLPMKTENDVKTINYKFKKQNILSRFFNAFARVMKRLFIILFHSARIFIAFILLLVTFPVLVSLLFVSGLAFTDFQFEHQSLLMQLDALFKIGVVGIIFSLLFLIFGIFMKLFYSKMLSNGFMLTGIISIFVFTFIGSIGFFTTFNEYQNIYSKKEVFVFESREFHLDNLNVFGESTTLFSGLNWIDEVSFKKSSDDNIKIEVVSKINSKSKEESEKIFSQLTLLNIQIDNGITYGLEGKSIFNNIVPYNFLRRQIIIHVPVGQEIQIGSFNTHNVHNVGNLYYQQLDGEYTDAYGLMNCQNKIISYNEEIKGFVCKK